MKRKAHLRLMPTLALLLVACVNHDPPPPRIISMWSATDLADRDYVALATNERIPLRDVTSTPNFISSPANSGASVVLSFVADDPRLYTIASWYESRPILADYTQLILPLTYPSQETSAIIVSRIQPPTFINEPNYPVCLPSLDGMAPRYVDGMDGNIRVGVWRPIDASIRRSLVVIFAHDLQCGAGVNADTRFYVLYDGPIVWRMATRLDELHLPPSIAMISEATVGESITFGFANLTGAGVTFPRVGQ